MIRTIGKGFLWLVKGLGIVGLWLLKAALEAAKLTLLLPAGARGITPPHLTTTEEKSETPATVEEAPSEEPVTEQTTEPEVTTQQTEPANASVSYSPDRVVSLAISKCIAGGMILTTENLNMLLANGSISEEEYNSYYPYDGLGYYSVFVETDLNKAATTSGRLLGSEEGIADYIAGMLLLEREPYFMIEYAGTTECGGQTFYEFCCYR